MAQTFGDHLRGWRRQRRLSQLELGLSATVSARHIAFLETGRANPSRGMVLQLADAMQVPRAARNALLKAAGFAEIYRARDMAVAEMAPFRAAVTWTLQRHDPYPAIALDRHWRVVEANVAATALLAAVDVGPGDSLLDALVTPAMRAACENWPEVMRHLLTRLRTENASLGGDPVLETAIAALTAATTEQPGLELPAELAAVVPTRYRFNGQVLSLFSTIAQFGTAEDIALADLKIELMFPADQTTEDLLWSAAPQAALAQPISASKHLRMP
jgi:transcriptional regulator with XRE-family HTH domain